MVANITQAAINLRNELDANRPATPNEPPFQRLNIGVGDGSNKTFTLPKGWKPITNGAFDDGSVQTEGSGDDYTVTFDGFVYSVVFAVAPTNLNVILTDAWRF